ncbi:MAG TPA: hypothetical protein VFN09_12205 [Rhodanobacteraceae bacterium]|nr:hypothetical protein [Rhodanobacteraceae bacterium]
MNLLGASLGSDLAPASPRNPRGYWEDRVINDLNAECLRLFDLRWDDPGELPANWLADPRLGAWSNALLEHLRAAYDQPLFLIKDPRLCRLLPIWLRVLQRLDVVPHVVLAMRDPAEVAASLSRRDSIPPVAAKQLWLRHVLDAEKSSRQLSRAFTTCDALLSRWQAVAEHLQRSLGIEWPRQPSAVTAEVERFLDAGLRHRAAGIPQTATPSPIHRLATRVYDYGCVESQGGSVPETCWDDALNSLRVHVDNHTEEPDLPAMGANGQTTFGLGLWEPAETQSEVLQTRLHYRSADGSMTEMQHCAAVVATHDQPMRAHFTLPAAATIDFIRFDPAMRPGLFRILRITINGRTLCGAELVLSAIHERRLPDEDGQLFAFACGDDDPYVEFDLRAVAAARTRPLQVEILFECDSLFSRIGRTLAQHRQALDTRLDVAQAHAESVNSGLQRLEEGYADLHSRLVSLGEAAATAAAHQQDRATGVLHGSGWMGATSPMDAAHELLQRRSVRIRIEAEQCRLLSVAPSRAPLLWRQSDPCARFRIAPADSSHLAVGWYLLESDLSSCLGHPVAARLAFTPAAANANMCSMPPIEGGSFLLHLPEPASHLTLYPGLPPAVEFQLSAPRLYAISRVQALARLGVQSIRTMRHEGHGWLAVGAHVIRAMAGKGSASTLLAVYGARLARTHGEDADSTRPNHGTEPTPPG